MPTRKQRRRRSKDRRHEWEYVYVDEEGREVGVADEAPEPAARNGRRSQKDGRAPAASIRGVQPPSWRRVGRRALLFAPLMFLTIHFLSAELTMTQKITNTAFLLAFFLPFSYAMDALVYRMSRRRAGGGGR